MYLSVFSTRLCTHRAAVISHGSSLATKAQPYHLLEAGHYESHEISRLILYVYMEYICIKKKKATETQSR